MAEGRRLVGAYKRPLLGKQAHKFFSMSGKDLPEAYTNASYWQAVVAPHALVVCNLDESMCTYVHP